MPIKRTQITLLILLGFMTLRVGLLRSQTQPDSQAVAADGMVPDAPGFSRVSLGGQEAPKGVGAISGTVLGPEGLILQNAQIMLSSSSGASDRNAVSGANGEFIFSELPPGTYKLTVTGPGMGTYVSPEIRVYPSELRMLPGIVLAVDSTSTEVRVSADPEFLAEEQVHIAVQQRVLGLLPNFYSSYDWNAPPMGTRQKYQLAFKSVTDPVAFAGAGFLAGYEQATNAYAGYGQEEMGYVKRFSASYANDFSGRMLGSAVFPSLFHQDPRYFYRGSGSKISRGMYAIGCVFISRQDNGRWAPNYSHLLGEFSSGGLSNLYYPAADRGLSLTLTNSLIQLAGSMGNNILREFLYKGLTSKVPTYGTGKP
jgi:hypothetical protein